MDAETIRQAFKQHKTQEATARALGISRRQVRKAIGKDPDRHRYAHTQPTIEGYTSDAPIDAEALWTQVITIQHRVAERVLDTKTDQRIVLPNEPCALAFLSDLHIGNPMTDYVALKRDAELIRDTPGMYAVFHGDGIDNWVLGKLQMQQRMQVVRFDIEVELFTDWLHILQDRLLVVVAGNHDNWTHKLAGIDIVKQALRQTRVLYDRQQVVFTLSLGSVNRTVVVRHKWRWHSVFNPTHGLNVGWERGDVDFDWAIGGHTHVGTYCHDVHKHARRRYLILTGTYKMSDAWGDELNLPSPKDHGCGAMVLHPDGREWFFRNLGEAAEFLAFLRQRGD